MSPEPEILVPLSLQWTGNSNVGGNTFLNMLQLIANLAPRLFRKGSQILLVAANLDNLFHRISEAA